MRKLQIDGFWPVIHSPELVSWKEMEFYKRLGLAAAAAVLQSLSFLPGFYWLAFLAVIPLFLLLARDIKLWVLLALFFIYRFLAMSGIVYFVFDPIMFAASTAVFLGFPLSFRIAERLDRRLAWVAAPFLWTFWDYLSARYTALPNFVMTVGNALGDSPFLGLASFGGLVSLTFFAVLINLLISETVRRRRTERRARLFLSGATLLLLLVAWSVSSAFLRENRAAYAERSGSARILLVSQKEGWDGDFYARKLGRPELGGLIRERLAELEAALAGLDAELLVLPEEMIDVDYDPEADPEAFRRFGISNNAVLIESFRALARGRGISLAANLTAVREGRRYNTILFFDGNGDLRDVFYKKYLAITGEYWPFPGWRPFYFEDALREYPEMADYAIFNPAKNFSSGETKAVRAAGLTLAPAICLEIHFPAEMRRRVALGADAILDTSSNLWAPEWGLPQYLRLTDKLRRIESVWLKTPILVNGRKEPPAIFLPDGQIIGRNSYRESGDLQILLVEPRI